MSRAGAECVRAPTLMRSTPVSAMARTVARVTPPDASSSTFGATASRRRTASRIVSGRHVVQQHDVRPAAQRLVELGEVVHLDLDGDAGPVQAARRLDRCANLLLAVAEGGEVVVLDEDAVEEAHAVVVAAAAADGVLLQQPPARHRLARVEHPALQAGDRIDVAAGLRGDAAEVLEEVERGALAGQDGAHRAGDAGQAAARLHGVAVAQERLELQARIEGGEDQGGGRQSRQHAGARATKTACPSSQPG